MSSLKFPSKGRRGGAAASTCNAAAEIFQIAGIMNGLVLVGVAVGFVLLRIEAFVEETEWEFHELFIIVFIYESLSSKREKVVYFFDSWYDVELNKLIVPYEFLVGDKSCTQSDLACYM